MSPASRATVRRAASGHREAGHQGDQCHDGHVEEALGEGVELQGEGDRQPDHEASSPQRPVPPQQDQVHQEWEQQGDRDVRLARHIVGQFVDVEAVDGPGQQRRPEPARQAPRGDEGRPGRGRRREQQRQVKRRDRAERGRDRPHEQGHRRRGGRPRGQVVPGRRPDLMRVQRIEPVRHGIGPPAPEPDEQVGINVPLPDLGHAQAADKGKSEPHDEDGEVDPQRQQPLQRRTGDAGPRCGRRRKHGGVRPGATLRFLVAGSRRVLPPVLIQ